MKEPAKRMSVAAAIGLFLMACSYVPEYLLDQSGISPADTFADNILIGIITGLLVYSWATLLTERETRRLLIERLKQEAVFEERHRVAREIHDTVAQTFMAVSLQLEAAKDILEDDSQGAQLRINRAQRMAREGLAEARRTVWALHSEALESDDLASALHRLTERIAEHREITAEFLLRGEPNELPGDVEANILRIAQEALSNAVKHSGARKIQVELAYEGEEARLSVQDDGKGFNSTNRKFHQGFGLTSMKERSQRIGASLSIESRHGAGTRINLSFPVLHLQTVREVNQ